MDRIQKIFIAGSITAVALVPLTAFALGFSFGGKVITPIPCLSPVGPAIFFTIVPAGLFPIGFIWAPGSLGIPPSHPAQQILGVADTLFGCTAGIVPLSGFRVQFDGVSL